MSGPWEAALLACGGLVAGIVNTLAGGGSLLTIPLLVLTGLPGTLANGTNRIGVLVMNGVATWRFAAEGVPGIRTALPVVLPVAVGALLGATAISRMGDVDFERLFGVVMLFLIVPILHPPRSGGGVPSAQTPDEETFRTRLTRPGMRLLFFGIGVYGGAIQAGVGFLLLFALSRAGLDLVRANSVKVAVNVVFVSLSSAVFIAAGKVVWIPALALAAGFACGGYLGARFAVRGGERLIRPILVLALIALAGRMLGLV